MSQVRNEVFASYVHANRGRIAPVCEWLEREGFNVWVDYTRLLPGQNWDFEIKRALDRAALVLVFVSHNSVDHRGYAQREIRLALDKANEKLIDDIYLVPIILDDDVKIPEQLRAVHHARVSDRRFEQQLAEAIRQQLARLGDRVTQVQQKHQIHWARTRLVEKWEGLPGYEIEVEFLVVTSDRYPDAAQLGDYIKGDQLKTLFAYRAAKLTQDPEKYSFGQDRFQRMRLYYAHCDDPVIKGKVISVRYSISWYEAGAAHNYYHYPSYTFLLEPVLPTPPLEHFFSRPDKALSVLQALSRAELAKVRVRYRDEDDGVPLDAGWIEKGTASWDDFREVLFAGAGLEVSFRPYQVGPFSTGAHSAVVPYEAVASLMHAQYRSALGIEHLVQ